MPSPTAQWFDAIGTYGSAVSLALVAGAACVLAAFAILATQMARALRRLIRHRRVARELARVHEAAYRERFGADGRLA